MFHLSLIDNSKEDSATTAAHSKQIIELLKNSKCLGDGHSTIWNNIDICAEHYRYSTAL